MAANWLFVAKATFPSMVQVWRYARIPAVLTYRDTARTLLPSANDRPLCAINQQKCRCSLGALPDLAKD
jgi:hypothetical protein